MPLKTPPPVLKVEDVNVEHVKEVISGLLSSNPVHLKATVYRYLHPYASIDHQLVKAEGRWDIFRALQANSAIFETRHQIHNILFDDTKLKAVALIDQKYKPRVPLRDWLLPEISAPTVVCLGFVKEPEGVIIKELVVLVSTDALAGIPLLQFVHNSLLKPFGSALASTISDGVQFGVACRAFVAKQFNL